MGESVESARAKGLNVKEVKLPMLFAGRYVAENRGGRGFIKLVVDTDRNCLAGCHMIGSYASEIIMTAVMMIDTGLPPERLKKLSSPIPPWRKSSGKPSFKFREVDYHAKMFAGRSQRAARAWCDPF